MPHSITITILVENSVARSGLLAEHGMAMWLDMGDSCVLFDTGQTGLLIDNANALGIDLDAVDAIALSHGHYDHTGAIDRVMAIAVAAPAIFLHPLALQSKYHCVRGAEPRYIGISESARAALSQSTNLHPTMTPTQIVPGLFLTGAVPRAHPEEKQEPGFFLDSEAATPDPLTDDQSLFLDTISGTVVLLGCAHAGIINTLEHIRNFTNNRPIRAVIGGTHLNAASQQRMTWTLEQLRNFCIQTIMPCHCTGIAAVAALWAAFPGKCLPCSVGTTLSF